MKASEIRQQNKTTLQSMLRELIKKQFRLKMQQGSSQLKENHNLQQVRRDIARIKTVMHEQDQSTKGE